MYKNQKYASPVVQFSDGYTLLYFIEYHTLCPTGKGGNVLEVLAVRDTHDCYIVIMTINDILLQPICVQTASPLSIQELSEEDNYNYPYYTTYLPSVAVIHECCSSSNCPAMWCKTCCEQNAQNISCYTTTTYKVVYKK